MPPFKTCGCGREYTAAGWQALPIKGYLLTEDDEGQYELEMRNCPCGSTIAVEEKLSNPQPYPAAPRG